MNEPFAFRGQWVTRENGERIAQLATDLVSRYVVDLKLFENWQVEKPMAGSRMLYDEQGNPNTWIRSVPSEGEAGCYRSAMGELVVIQLCIEGKWLPEVKEPKRKRPWWF